MNYIYLHSKMPVNSSITYIDDVYRMRSSFLEFFKQRWINKNTFLFLKQRWINKNTLLQNIIYIYHVC